MNIRDELLKPRSKESMLRIRDYIGEDTGRFSELMEVFLNDTTRLMELAGWAFSHCTDAHPRLVIPYIPYLIPYAKSAPHPSITRNIVRALTLVDLDPDDEGPIFDMCLEFARSARQEIAIRVHALTVLARIAMRYPELAPEVLALARDFKEYESAGLRCRGKRVEKEMRKLVSDQAG